MPEGDYGINFVDSDAWYAVQKGGETIVIAYDPCVFTYDSKIGKIADIVRRRIKKGWEGYKEVTEPEAETLSEICDIPIIQIHDIAKWEEEQALAKVEATWWKKIVNKTLKREN